MGRKRERERTHRRVAVDENELAELARARSLMRQTETLSRLKREEEEAFRNDLFESENQSHSIASPHQNTHQNTELSCGESNMKKRKLEKEDTGESEGKCKCKLRVYFTFETFFHRAFFG
jgi:hypothetical protein